MTRSILAVAFCLAAGGPSAAGERDSSSTIPPAVLPAGPEGAVDPGLIGESGTRGKRDRLDPREETALLNKPRIAEETTGRVIGLREAGNPHIPKGLLLAEHKIDAEASKVDAKKLHENLLRSIENHEIGKVVQMEPARPAAAGGTRGGLEQAIKRKASGPGLAEILLAVCGAGLLASAALVLSVKR